MWRKIQPIVLILSLAMNAGLASAWVAGLVRQKTTVDCCAQAHTESNIWCPLHRRLGVSEVQWRDIEPRMLAFHDSSRILCRRMQMVRGEVMDLLAADNPDLAAVKTRKEDIASQQQAMQQLVLRHLLREKEILTPEQWQELLELIRGREGCGGHGPLRTMYTEARCDR